MASKSKSSAHGIVFQKSERTTINFYSTIPSPSILPKPLPGLIFVFVHDWAGSPSEYGPLLSLLAKRRPHDRFVAISTPPDGTRKADDTSARSATLISGIAELAVLACFELAGQTIQQYNGSVPSFVIVGHGHGCRIALEMMRENANYENALRIVGLVMQDGASHLVSPKMALLERWDEQNASDGPCDKSALGKANFSATKEPRRSMMLNIVATVKPTAPSEFLVNYLRGVSGVAEPYATDSLRRLGIWDKEDFPQLVRNLAKGEYGADVEVRILGSAETNYGKAVRLRSNETNSFQDYWLGTFCFYGQGQRCEIATFQDLSHWAHVDDPEAVAQVLVPFARHLLEDERVDPEELVEVTVPADVESARLVVATRDRKRHESTWDVKQGSHSGTEEDVKHSVDNGYREDVKHNVNKDAEAYIRPDVTEADVKEDVKGKADDDSDGSVVKDAKRVDGRVKEEQEEEEDGRAEVDSQAEEDGIAEQDVQA